MAGASTLRWQGFGNVSVPNPCHETSTGGKGGRPKGEHLAYTTMFDVWQRKGIWLQKYIFASFTIPSRNPQWTHMSSHESWIVNSENDLISSNRWPSLHSTQWSIISIPIKWSGHLHHSNSMIDSVNSSLILNHVCQIAWARKLYRGIQYHM